MTTSWLIYACLAIGLSSALVAGVFQSFSDFVMRGLIAAEPSGGIQSMQMINRTVLRSIFLILLLGLAPVLLAFGVYATFNLSGAAQFWVIGGSLIYLISVIVVTILGNVPMNNRLDGMVIASVETEAYWKTYAVVWTNWNHVRTFGSLATSICFLVASTKFV